MSGAERTFGVCSGQGPRHNRYAVFLNRGRTWWRARDRRGRVRLFHSYEAAERVARKMEANPGLYFSEEKSYTSQ